MRAFFCVLLAGLGLASTWMACSRRQEQTVPDVVMPASDVSSGLVVEDAGRAFSEAPVDDKPASLINRLLRARLDGDRAPPADWREAGVPITDLFAAGSQSADDAEEDALFMASEPVVARLMDLLNEDDQFAVIAEAERLIHHTNRMVRRSVMEALWWVGPPALVAMAPLMDDTDPEIKTWAIETFFEDLALLLDKHAVADVLTIAARSPDADIRMQVIDELAMLPPAFAFPLLAFMIEDVDPDVADAAQLQIAIYTGDDFTSTQAAMDWFEVNKADLDEESDLEQEDDLMKERLLPIGQRSQSEEQQ